MLSFFQIKNYILLIFLLSISNRLAVAHSIELLKPINVFLFIFLFFTSLRCVLTNKDYLNMKSIRPMLFWFILFVIMSLIVDVINNFSLKSFTDAFFIRFQYYAMVIIAIPAAIFIVNTNNFFEIYFKNVKLIFIFCVLLSLLIFNIYDFGNAYSLIVNLILPASFLCFSKKKNHKIFGFLFLSLGFIYVSTMASRSYFLVLIYILLLFVLNFLKSRKVHEYLKYFLPTVFLIFFIAISSVLDRFTNSPLYEKLQVESLIALSTNDSSSASLEDYEGDSRSMILKDAFKNFEMIDYLLGKGVFEKYESFTERNTIEIGWVQEGFWFGFIFVGFSFFYFLRSSILCLKSNNYVYNLFGFIIIVKVLDAFIYGMPGVSVYNFLVFIGLFLPYVKDKRILNN